MSLTLHFGLAQHNFLRSLRVQLLLTFSETNLLDFSESASPAAPLAAEAACIMAPEFGVLGNGYSRESVSAPT